MVGALERYEEAVAAGPPAAATAVIGGMLGAGVPPISVLTEVIAAAQRKVGARWQRGEWTVAQEHAATAVAVAATKTVARYVRRTPPTRGRLVIACAGGEWHALPAMLVESALRADGWDTTLLGASTSSLRLSQYLQDLGPEAVAVSCSMLGALPATRRFIEACTAAGVPVIVGGAAFGSDDRRARALAATAWAPDARGAVTAMIGISAVVAPAPPLPRAVIRELAGLEMDHRQLVAALRAQWSLTAGTVVSGQEPSARALIAADEGLPQLVHAVTAALLTGDPRPVSETFAWIVDLMQARGVDEAQVDELRPLLVATLADHPQVQELVEQQFANGQG